jgi:4,5-DOPA dioxygenase extradiol
MGTAPLPALFVSHGSPTLALDRTRAHEHLRRLGRELPRPRAILAASAHFASDVPTLGAAERPETVHDFHGFPEALDRLRHPAPGDPELAARAADLLREAGFDVRLDPARGLDHGIWVPLLLMDPEADIPVVPLSVQPGRDARHHLAVGRALAPLRREGVLVLGSGAATHNLADALAHLRRGGAAEGTPPPAWATAFTRWLDDTVAAGDTDTLVRWRELAPFAERAHPTDEHLLPFFVAAGAGGGRGRRLFESFEYGSLAMSVWAFG